MADVLVTGLWLAQGLRRGLGVAHSLARYRHHMSLVRAGSRSDRNLIQGMPAVTTLFSILGPLPQAVKILAADGPLGWTKTWAAVFLIAWLVEVGVRFGSGFSRALPPVTVDEETRIMQKVSRAIHVAAFVTQFAVWIWIVFAVAFSRFSRVTLGNDWAFVASLCVFLITSLFVSGLASAWWGGTKDVFPYLMLHGLICCCVIYPIMFSATYLKMLKDQGAPGFLGFFLFCLAIFSFVGVARKILLMLDSVLVQLGRTEQENSASADSLANRSSSVTMPDGWGEMESFPRRIFWRLPYPWSTVRQANKRRMLAITFLLANLSTTFLYYCIKYDGTGTRKASWAKILG